MKTHIIILFLVLMSACAVEVQQEPETDWEPAIGKELVFNELYNTSLRTVRAERLLVDQDGAVYIETNFLNQWVYDTDGTHTTTIQQGFFTKPEQHLQLHYQDDTLSLTIPRGLTKEYGEIEVKDIVFYDVSDIGNFAAVITQGSEHFNIILYEIEARDV